MKATKTIPEEVIASKDLEYTIQAVVLNSDKTIGFKGVDGDNNRVDVKINAATIWDGLTSTQKTAINNFINQAFADKMEIDVSAITENFWT